MTDLPALLAAAERAEAESREATQRARKARALLQFHCPHDRVIGSDSGGGSTYFPLTPFRVCLTCGFAEKSWGCGNTILAGGLERDHVPYNEALQHAQGIHENRQFVGYYLDVQAAGGQAAYIRAVLLSALGLTEDDVNGAEG